MNEPLKQLPITLQLRTENGMWNAYVVFQGFDIEPIKLGSIAMGAIVNNERRKDAFKNMMIATMNDLVEQVIGQRPVRHEERPAGHD